MAKFKVHKARVSKRDLLLHVSNSNSQLLFHDPRGSLFHDPRITAETVFHDPCIPRRRPVYSTFHDPHPSTAVFHACVELMYRNAATNSSIDRRHCALQLSIQNCHSAQTTVRSNETDSDTSHDNYMLSPDAGANAKPTYGCSAETRLAEPHSLSLPTVHSIVHAVRACVASST